VSVEYHAPTALPLKKGSPFFSKQVAQLVLDSVRKLWRREKRDWEIEMIYIVTWSVSHLREMFVRFRIPLFYSFLCETNECRGP